MHEPLRLPDLRRDTEQTRRKLYDLVVQMQFSPIPNAEPDDYPGPSYTPDDAGLKVFYAFSRWFAAWTNLEEPGLPDEQRIELVRIEADPSSRFGIILHEV